MITTYYAAHNRFIKFACRANFACAYTVLFQLINLMYEYLIGQARLYFVVIGRGYISFLVKLKISEATLFVYS